MTAEVVLDPTGIPALLSESPSRYPVEMRLDWPFKKINLTWYFASPVPMICRATAAQ
jgi:hypothetical protein